MQLSENVEEFVTGRIGLLVFGGKFYASLDILTLCYVFREIQTRTC